MGKWLPNILNCDNPRQKMEYRQDKQNESKNRWKNKKMYSMYVRKLPQTAGENKMQELLRKSDLKVETGFDFTGLDS